MAKPLAQAFFFLLHATPLPPWIDIAFLVLKKIK
jgi:hypothetical protein